MRSTMDSQDTVQPCTYPALYAIAVECSDKCEKMPQTEPKAQTRPAPAISFFLIAEFRFFGVYS